jgi:hypothetical protein
MQWIRRYILFHAQGNRFSIDRTHRPSTPKSQIREYSSYGIGPLANLSIWINWVMSDWAKIEPVLRGQAFMVSDELGMQLHDRDTIGEPLTAQEKAQLEAWYAQKDVAEAAMLEAGQVPLPNLVVLQDQVDTVISQLTVGVQQLQQITQENKSLREEIAEIKQQLAIPHSA